MKIYSFPIVAALICSGAPVAAQNTAPSPAAQAPLAAPTPDRLAAAQKLVDTLYPAADREKYFERMVTPIIDNMINAFAVDPIYKENLKNPTKRARFNRYVAKARDLAISNMRESMPGTINAAVQAYARHFTVAELTDLTTFFAAPAGRAYLAKMPELMRDPAIAEAQTKSMIAGNAKLKILMDEYIAESISGKGQ